MNYKQREKINKINKNLIKHYGVPYRAEVPPEPLEMLVATILSQNTNDNNSFQALQNLKLKYSSMSKLMNADVLEIEETIRVAGLAKQKSVAIKSFLTELYSKQNKLSLVYINNYSSEDAIKELTAFKGVGVKTASCVLLFALNKNVCPVDTHVFRTVNRIGIVKGSAPDKTFYLLNDKFPENIAHEFHTNLIKLGRQFCKPKNPSCGVCPLKRNCKYENKNINNKVARKQRNFMLLDNVN